MRQITRQAGRQSVPASARYTSVSLPGWWYDTTPPRLTHTHTPSILLHPACPPPTHLPTFSRLPLTHTSLPSLYLPLSHLPTYLPTFSLSSLPTYLPPLVFSHLPTTSRLPLTIVYIPTYLLPLVSHSYLLGLPTYRPTYPPLLYLVSPLHLPTYTYLPSLVSPSRLPTYLTHSPTSPILSYLPPPPLFSTPPLLTTTHIVQQVSGQ